MPRSSYRRALGFVALWGVLIVFVLTLISGARELLKPGAWQKNGATSKLATVEKTPDEVESERTVMIDEIKILSEVEAEESLLKELKQAGY